MDRRFARSLAAAALAAICLIGSDSIWFQRLTTPLSAQQVGERIPGPLIQDPPGPNAGHSYVPAPSSVTTGPAEARSTFQVTYTGFPPQAQAAFAAAANMWAEQISSTVPITVSANWVPLGADVLGSARANNLWHDSPGAPVANTWYPDAIANKSAGFDLDPSPDIIANFNSTLAWYYGTDGNAGANYDLMTVVLHELGHGLGFFGSMSVGFRGSWGVINGVSTGVPIIYDRFAFNASSQLLINTAIFPNPGLALSSQLVSNNLFFDGTNTRNANGGNAAKLYAPNIWQPESSYSHLNESTFPAGNVNSLMTPQIGAGEAIHETGPVTRGVFADIGWGPVASCSYALSAASVGVGSVAWSGTVNVVTTAGCPWTAASNASFITISGGGIGSGAVSYTVAANSGAPRSGTLTIGGTVVTITQNARNTITSDFDNDGRSDVTVFRPSNGTWYIRNSATGLNEGLTWGGTGDVPVVGDYDGDNKNDMAVFRPSNGTWYLRSSINGGLTTFLWGGVGDVPVQGDYEGDRKTDVAVFRPSNGTWYIRHSSTGALFGLVWGGAGDVAVPGDYDADGKTDLAVFRPSNGTWYIRSSITGALTTAVWGGVGDVAVPGDYDSDGRTDIAIFRASNGTWYIRNSSTGLDEGLLWGGAGDVPVPADYDGDGKTDMAVFRPSNGTWFIRNSSTGLLTQVVWGGGSDIPVLRRQ